MPSNAVRALLDNNAWIDIVTRDSSGQMLTKLQQAVARESVGILVPSAAIEETMAFAATDGAATRRRLAYMRAFGHGHLLRDVGELAHMEIRGEPTEGHIFMPDDDATSLYAVALEAADNHGTFTAPTDGKTYDASNIANDTKNSALDGGRSSDKGTETEIVSAWTSRHSGTIQDGVVLTDGLELTPDATSEEVLQAYGNRMTRQAERIFEAWVRDILAKAGAAADVITDDAAHHPFFSSCVAYDYAHLGRHLRNGTLWARGDSYDRHYCVLGVAADILVTSDTGLQRTCQLMPFRPFDVLSVQEFIEKLE
ncbi:MAG TPA: hypothetical protein VII15_03470 [Candidatus Cryosericum sp.]